MKKIIILTVGFLSMIICLFSSCTPEPLPLKIADSSPKVVVASQFAFDSSSNQNLLIVILTRSLAVGNGFTPIADSSGLNIPDELRFTNATVEVHTSSGVITCAEVDGGVYVATNISFEAGATAKLTIKQADGTLVADAITPMMTSTSFSMISLARVSNFYEVSYILDDNTKEKNWYVVNYFTGNTRDSGSVTDPGYIARKLTEQKAEFDLFTDKDFNNGTLAVRKNIGASVLDTVVVAVSSISEGYFNFLTVQKRYGSLINQIRGEALTFPTNISNGLGYFTFHQPKLYILTTD
ncbi:MAG: DUF4249 domain-containing protein [Bacteroidia bacterium]|jgi:hypothetical protein|nr:DUF4249 domain-containing protein [Bacteroidia bacterium]